MKNTMPAGRQVDLSIIIVNFNAGRLLQKCLESLGEATSDTRYSYEIFVVDNASTDGSVEEIEKRYEDIKILRNRENMGFSRAVNQALKLVSGRYILLLNPDTIVPQETLPYMLEFMDKNEKVGIATCRVELPNETLDWACHRGFPTPWASLTYFLGLEKLFPKSRVFASYHQTYKDLSKSHEIDSPCGAFYLIRKKVIEEIGLLDEDYFMYAEDLDFAFRAKQKGWKVMYVPEIKIIHYKGVSSGIKEHSQEITTATREAKIRALSAFYETMKTFYKKHYAPRYPFFVNWLVYLSINLKWWLALRKI